MATTRSFSTMLKQYMPNALLMEEFKKRMWLMENCEDDQSWKGGDLIVPFEGGAASSIAFGSLTASDDVSEDTLVRGSITTQPEVWGTFLFNDRDLMEHDQLSDKSFLKILPGRLERFLGNMKNMVNLAVLNGPIVATLTQNGDTNGTGVIDVDRPERFWLSQKLQLDDDNSSSVAVYVIAINRNTKRITVSDTRGGSAFSVSGYTTAQNAVLYYDGAQTAGNRLTSLKSALLPASVTSGGVAGASTLYGQTKTTYPYLQAVAYDGSGINGANILDSIFDAYAQCRIYGSGNPTKAVMSFRHLGAVMKLLETQKGAFHIDPKSTKVSPYGWTEITVFGVEGQLTLVGLQEMCNDSIHLLDPASLKLYSNGGFKKRKSPDGLEYYQTRATTGYSMLVDTCFFGDFVLIGASRCGIVHSIPAYSTI